MAHSASKVTAFLCHSSYVSIGVVLTVFNFVSHFMRFIMYWNHAAPPVPYYVSFFFCQIVLLVYLVSILLVLVNPVPSSCSSSCAICFFFFLHIILNPTSAANHGHFCVYFCVIVFVYHSVLLRLIFCQNCCISLFIQLLAAQPLSYQVCQVFNSCVFTCT